MKNLHLIGLGALLSVVIACTSQPETSNGAEGQATSPISTDPAESACVAAGGTCVGLAPSSCPSGNWGDATTHSCGGGIGVGCCLPLGPSAEPDADPAPGCTPLPKSTGGAGIGMANPAAAYCGALGYQYQLDNGQCVFPDGTSCEGWAFYRGECGQVHSFCNLHGGAVANKIEDMGTWTASYALCTLPNGKQCHEDAFAQSCVCE